MEQINPALVPWRKSNNQMVIPGIGMGTCANPVSIYEKEYVGNLKCITEDFLTEGE